MLKYVFQLRRGWKTTDTDGNVTRNDWADYENKENHQLPLAGELVLEYDNGVPRLKNGDGEHEFSELPYMSVDSFILPKPISVTIYADRWIQDFDNRWYQVVTVDNATITSNSKVDLQPSAEQLTIFYEKDLAFVAENEDGIISVYCVGQVPQNDYTIQTTVTEVLANG